MLRKSFICFSLLLSFMALVSIPVWCAEIPTYRISETDLQRLIEIMQRLEQLNSKLSNELNVSRMNLQELQNELTASKSELIELKTELKALQQASNELSEQLQTVENSLEKAWKSYELYRKAAELQIRRLKWQRNILFFGNVVFLILLI